MARKKKADPPAGSEPQPQEWLIPIAQRLRRARKLIDISQTTAGSAVGVTSAAWSQWERALYPPSIEALLWITSRTRVPVDWILRGDIVASMPTDVARNLLTDEEFWRHFPEQRRQPGRRAN